MAATDFHVAGPVRIDWALSGTASTQLGVTDNEDLVRITAVDHRRTFSRNDQGDMIGEVVYSGSTFTIDFTMVAWDQTEIQKLIERCRAGTSAGAVTAEGLFAPIGKTGINNTNPNTISLKISPTTVGEIVYNFDKVLLASGPEYLDFGNTLKRIALSFVTTAPASGAVVATTSAKA